ncbi:MAG: MFS transporter, partial [Clostridia bacterium]|nr:MFS transporter [Clostridia bacterium]
MVQQCNEICKEYGLPVYEEKEEVKEEKKPKISMLKEYGPKKMTSFLLILGAIFMWFIGYYAIANNMPIYCVKILGVSTGLASIVSGASLVVAAIGFIPVGIMGRKIGRRWSIIFGFGLAVISYLLVAIFVSKASDTATIIFMACYMVSGFGLIFANVNTLPMVLEVSSPEDIGKFTGIYYIATMSAQTLGPIFGGLVMDYIGGSKALFIFSAVCVALGAVMMLFVKHGEAPDYLNLVASRKAAKLEKAGK